MSDRFRFRLEQVLDHRVRREDLVRQELAQAMAAVAAQQERAVAADDAVRRGLEGLRRMMGEPIGLDRLRAAHEDLAILRARAAHERSGVARLEAVADDRRADMVRASQDREALVQLRRKAQLRHGAELERRDAVLMDELASRRAGRGHQGAAA